MEIRLPEEEITRIQNTLEKWFTKKSATKCKILSLVGQLQHAIKVVRCGHTFTSRMYATATKVKKLHYYTRLNTQFRLDLAWWHTILHHWNCLSILQDSSSVSSTQITIQTDASGSWGYGTIYGHLWLQLRWSKEWERQDITEKEFVPVVLVMAEWGPLLSKQSVLLQCNNLSLMTSINKGTAKPSLVMHLLHSLWFFTAHYDTLLTAKHILGVTNTTADQISQNQFSLFHQTNPAASRLPTPIPTSLQKLFLHRNQTGKKF